MPPEVTRGHIPAKHLEEVFVDLPDPEHQEETSYHLDCPSPPDLIRMLLGAQATLADGNLENFRLARNRQNLDGLLSRLERADVPIPHEALFLDLRREFTEGLDLPRRKRRKLRQRREQGEEITPELFVQRDPLMWTEMARIPRFKNRISIMVNVGLPSRNTNEAALRAAALSTLADLLVTYHGISPEIILGDGSRNLVSFTTPSDKDNFDTFSSLVTTTVKDSNDPLSVKDLCVLFGEPDLLPLLVFPTLLLLSPHPNLDPGFGTPAPYTHFSSWARPIDWVLNRPLRTREQAMHWIRTSLDSLCPPDPPDSSSPS